MSFDHPIKRLRHSLDQEEARFSVEPMEAGDAIDTLDDIAAAFSRAARALRKYQGAEYGDVLTVHWRGYYIEIVNETTGWSSKIAP